MEYKLKNNYTGIIEDIGGEVTIDHIIEIFLQGHDSWTEAISSNFYDYDDCGWHERGPTDVVDTLVLENGDERNLNIARPNIDDSKSLSDFEKLGDEIFFSHAVAHEKGKWESESFELEHEFNDECLTAEVEVIESFASIFIMYVYDNPDTDEFIEIEGEVLESRGSGVDMALYINTRDGVVKCDDFYEWREEMEEKGMDTSSAEEVKKYLIEKYNLDLQI